MKSINVISCFDGMGCLMIALKELGIKVNKYYVFEIDKFCINQTKYNFPGIIHLGSVTDWQKHDIDFNTIDLIAGGSPCTGFSFAGKGLNFEDPQSKLFFDFVNILNHAKKFNPEVKFLLENVNMKKEHLRVISEYMGIFPVNLNSNLVSAQNRNRWFWSNIKTKKVGLFSELHTDITQPKDKGILLKDILQPENEIEEKYYIKNPKFGFEGMNINKKSNSLRTGEKKSQSKKHNYDIICVAMVGRKLDENGIRKDYDKNIKTKQQLEQRTDGKTNTITGVQKDNLLLIDNSRKNERIRTYSEKSPPLKTGNHNTPKLIQGYRLRRLTPIEVARLQTIPDWYKWKQSEEKETSDSQIYRQCGNGWTIEIIKWIISFNFVSLKNVH